MVGAGRRLTNGGGRGRITGAWEALRASFGFPSGVAMLAGIVAGAALPALDELLGVDLPVLSFESQSSARSLLETIGTTTVAVAGLSFSVTVVAFTLASSQLSPRVLRSFRSDRLSQVTLALFLGTFVYCLVLLVRLGVRGDGAEPPNLSVTFAVLLALAAFAMFAGFIAHIVSMLQPSSVIDAIRSDAATVVANRYPSGLGEPDDADLSTQHAERALARSEGRVVAAPRAGYLNLVDVGAIVDAADAADALVRQRVVVGSYVLPGQALAECYCAGRSDDLEQAIGAGFKVSRQRTLVQDIAFPVRQLADVALKGLSPGVNDPTTAINAMEALTAVLIQFAHSERPAAVRVGAGGAPRLVTLAPDLGDLVGLGFNEVRVSAGRLPAVSIRLVELLDEIERAAATAGIETSVMSTQRRLIAAGTGEEGPTAADRERVRVAADRGGDDS